MPKSKKYAKARTISVFLKIVLCFLALSATLAISLSSSSAQTANTLKKAQDDYAFQYSKYVDSDNAYQASLATYLTFKTANAKEAAFGKTQAKISQTDNMYIAYLLLANEIGNSFDWQSQSSLKQPVVASLNNEISFFQTNQKNLYSIQTLEELPAFAKNLSDHIKNVTNPLVTKTQATYRITQTQVALDSFQNTANDLKDYASQKLQGTASISFFANWNSEIEKIRSDTQNQINLAKQEAIVADFNDTNLFNLTRDTKTAQDILNSAIPVFNDVANIK